jgi:hypothetical protein
VTALLPYSVVYLAWFLPASCPYAGVMRAIDGHNFGVLLALALAAPMVFINAMVRQTGFLTAALIDGTL